MKSDVEMQPSIEIHASKDANMKVYVVKDDCILPLPIALNKPTNRNCCEASKYLDPDSCSYYELATERITIFPSEHVHLNAYGKLELQSLRSKQKTKELTEARLERTYSGCWMPNKSSPHWKESDCGYITGLENRCLVGNSTELGHVVTTSTIRFFELDSDNKSGWAVTMSGSCYKFSLA